MTNTWVGIPRHVPLELIKQLRNRPQFDQTSWMNGWIADMRSLWCDNAHGMSAPDRVAGQSCDRIVIRPNYGATKVRSQIVAASLPSLWRHMPDQPHRLACPLPYLGSIPPAGAGKRCRSW